MRLAGLALGVAALWLGACSNPCDRLMKKVCGCPGERAKIACAEAKKHRKMKDKKSLDKTRCRKQLESFRCDQLK